MATGVYYVAAVDKKTGKQIPDSRIDCEDALDAKLSFDMLHEIDPTVDYVIGYEPSEEERSTFVHVCRGCNCQFDRRSRLAVNG